MRPGLIVHGELELVSSSMIRARAFLLVCKSIAKNRLRFNCIRGHTVVRLSLYCFVRRRPLYY